MKFLSFLIYPVLTLSSSCYAMEIVQAEPTKNKLKRSSSLNLEGAERNSKKIREPKVENEKNLSEFKAENNKRLLQKTKVLMEELPNVIKSLHKISEELRMKALHHKDNSFELATELAGLGVHAITLDRSTSLILNNLTPFFKGFKEEKNLVNASLAIIGSGALNIHINDFVKVLNNSENTKYINCDILKNSSLPVTFLKGCIFSQFQKI
jgi:hypothetical protein